MTSGHTAAPREYISSMASSSTAQGAPNVVPPGKTGTSHPAQQENARNTVTGPAADRLCSGTISNDKEYLAQLAAYALNQVEFSSKPWEYQPTIDNFRKLRQYSLEHIARQLDSLNHKAFITKDPTTQDLDRLRVLLHEQVIAMQDMEYIFSHLQATQGVEHKNIDDIRIQLMPSFPVNQYRGWKFGLPGDTVEDILKDFLKRHLPSSLKWTGDEKSRYGFPFRQELLPKGQLPKQDSATVRIISSFVLSLCSGSTVIVPMIIMSFTPSQTKSLIVTSVAVLLFGFVLAAVMRIKSEGVFIATVTYAAVLVVFIGSSGTATA